MIPRRRNLLLAAGVLTAVTCCGWAAAGFDPGPPRTKPSKPVKKGRAKGFGAAPAAGTRRVSREEQRRQQRLGKDPSMNDARKVLLSETAEQRFSLGEAAIDLVIPAYVLDISRFTREVEAGAGTVSDIVWPAEQVLAEILLQRKELWQGRGLCEIGAGLGLAGIAAAKLGAPKVLISDRDSLVLELSKQSAQRNGVADRVTTAAFDWSDKDSWPPPFGGMIAAADVLYDKEVVAWLVDLIIHFAGPALLMEPDNIERRQLGSVSYFEEIARSRGLAVKTEKALHKTRLFLSFALLMHGIVSFNIEVEYEADWTQEEGDGAAALRPAETGRAIFCGSSDVSTATSSSAWPEDLQERLDAEEDEVLIRQKELTGRSDRRSRKCGHHRDLPEEVTGQSDAAQPQVRILVRSAVAEPKPCDEGRPAKKSVPRHQQEEDPWVSGLDPWAAAKLPRGTQKAQASEPRRASAPTGKGRRGNGRN
ncbi:unnamed protein product [Symbiodinium sp. CCMP2592]|nr:unnamed protein product [Symbiodinium sp. CCMP2592]